MAYPFLPVNPCCTDVVINNPCGCSPAITNHNCGQSPCGTNVILSSNVLYNGPVLDCIIAEPCDTLNVILQKIDEIICNLLTQINSLNIQVNNITQQIININGDIININNTLDVCCNVTTTTSTSSSTTTTSSSSSTTTTTTTISEFICFAIYQESEGDENPILYTEEIPLEGNAPFQNGRPVYNIEGPFPGSLYYNGSQWVYAIEDFAPVLQPLLNSSYYPIGTYSEWGSPGVTGAMYSSTLNGCPSLPA